MNKECIPLPKCYWIRPWLKLQPRKDKSFREKKSMEKKNHDKPPRNPHAGNKQKSIRLDRKTHRLFKNQSQSGPLLQQASLLKKHRTERGRKPVGFCITPLKKSFR